MAQLHVYHADADQAERHARAVAQQQHQLQRAGAAERLVPVVAELEGVVWPKGDGDEQQRKRARPQVLRNGLERNLGRDLGPHLAKGWNEGGEG